mmetsp:Transcript_61218/g.200095  ORF Transcript_61218/g.200095 Transcript_61218/m.200095 type:complete len:314 (+) Transcript_61218:164-1105(+)
MLSIRLALLLLASAVQFCSGGYVPPTKYLIVSNARNGTIGYVKLSRTGQHSPVRILIDKQLVHPQGIAVDQKRQLLLIADSELKKVVSYGLLVREDGSLGVDEQTPVAEDVEARWVTVDGLGNVYLTDEEQGKVFKISAQQMLDGDTEARPAYAEAGPGDSSGGVAAGGAVSAPGGIATDNFHVFWTNKEQGETVGTVMKALQVPGRASGGGGGSSNSDVARGRGRQREVVRALAGALRQGADLAEVFQVAARREKVPDLQDAEKLEGAHLLVVILVHATESIVGLFAGQGRVEVRSSCSEGVEVDTTACLRL